MALTIINGNGETPAAGGRVQNAILTAASATGVDFGYLYKQASIESGLNPTASARTSSASGLYQFTEQTWLGVVKKHGAEHGLDWAANAITKGSNGHYYVSDPTTRQEILALRQSPEMSAQMAGEYAADNKQILEANLGRPADSVDLYLAHFLGPAGATRFLKAYDANPNASAAAVDPAAARANRWVFYDKSGAARSVAEVRARFAARFNESGAPAPAASSAPTDTEMAAMRLAALNGVGATSASRTPATTASDLLASLADPNNTMTTRDLNLASLKASSAALTPSPQTARLAYLMLSSLGV